MHLHPDDADSAPPVATLCDEVGSSYARRHELCYHRTPLMSRSRVDYVYLDTACYEAECYDFTGTRLRALAKHLESGRLRLITTDITKAEVTRRIADNIQTELASFRKLERRARTLRVARRLAHTDPFLNLDAAILARKLHDAFEEFLRTHRSICMEATKLSASSVFRKYFSQEPPFGTGKKRREFPDAFVLEALIDWSGRNNDDVFVVSGDRLLATACEKLETLQPIKSLALLLDHVASDDKTVALFLRDELKDRLDQIKKKATADFQELGFHVVDEWGDVEMNVTDMELYGEPDIVDISGNTVTAEIQFTAHYDAHLSYEDAPSGMYDKEEGRRVFVDFVDETISDLELLVVTVKATFEGIASERFRIQDIRLTDPMEGFGISPARGREYR